LLGIPWWWANPGNERPFVIGIAVWLVVGPWSVRRILGLTYSGVSVQVRRNSRVDDVRKLSYFESLRVAWFLVWWPLLIVLPIYVVVVMVGWLIQQGPKPPLLAPSLPGAPGVIDAVFFLALYWSAVPRLFRRAFHPFQLELAEAANPVEAVEATRSGEPA
jgi:hypothetical protein